MAERISLPASFGGITRYFEEYKSKIEIKPEAIILIIIIIVILELIINLFG
jgi:preprotein translocase subunit Sec61beta